MLTGLKSEMQRNPENCAKDETEEPIAGIFNADGRDEKRYCPERTLSVPTSPLRNHRSAATRESTSS
ncbi:MAG TPA: hypothetical protein VEI52_10670 [Terriglobales bacterium]|nr:hypothetical protein [Terriglobales bacterium]